MLSLIIAVTLQEPVVLPPWTSKALAQCYSYWTGFDAKHLVLRLDGSFRFTYTDDVIVPGEDNLEVRTGKWNLKDEVVTILFSKSWRKYSEIKFIPVRWGKSICLVDSTDPSDFVVEVNTWRREARAEKRVMAFEKPVLSVGHVDVFAPIQVPRRFLKDFSGIKQAAISRSTEAIANGRMRKVNRLGDEHNAM